jgi:hypothetical protein
VEQQQAHASDLLSLTAKSALTNTADSKRLMVRQVSARSRLKAAIMTVSMANKMLHSKPDAGGSGLSYCVPGAVVTHCVTLAT